MPKPSWLAVIGVPVACAFVAVAQLTAVTNNAVRGGVGGLCGLCFGAYMIYRRLFEVHWSATRGHLIRRIFFHGSRLQEKVFVVEALQINNRVWKTGGGSSDKLELIQRTEYGLAFTKVTDRSGVSGRRSPATDRPGVAAGVLDLAEYLATQACVPLELVVSYIAEPSAD